MDGGFADKAVVAHLLTVRRQGFGNQWRPEQRERLAHLLGLIARRAGGDASVDLLPWNVRRFWLACSPTEETDDEEKPFQRRTNHWYFEGASGWAWREGWEVNWKKLYRLYREEGLTVCKRSGRKRAVGTRTPMAIPQGPNQRWSLHFMSDALEEGRRFRVLSVIDDFSRE